jgi:hypothetical protein
MKTPNWGTVPGSIFGFRFCLDVEPPQRAPYLFSFTPLQMFPAKPLSLGELDIS